MYYNFGRTHQSLRYRKPGACNYTQRTPAMAAGITERVWDVRELLA